MNDTTQPNLPGFEEWPELKHNLLPDFGQMMAQRLAPKVGDFDPYSLMIKKNQIEKGEILSDTIPTVKWPEKDIKALEDFCLKHGIIGYNPGRMSPVVALALLKQQIGLGDIPLEERVPSGYEKIGTKNPYSPNHSYSTVMKNKNIIHG